MKKTIKPIKKMKTGGAKKCPPNYCPDTNDVCVYCGGAKWAGRILSTGFAALGNKIFKDASKKSAEKQVVKKQVDDAINTVKKTSIKKKGGSVKSKKK